MSNRKKEFDKLTVQLFRKDFQEAIMGLEKKYGCHISLGTLRYDSNEVRGKMTAQKGKTLAEKKSENRFKIGDRVKIVHKKADPQIEYVINKINKKSIKVHKVDDMFDIWKVSSNLLELV